MRRRILQGKHRPDGAIKQWYRTTSSLAKISGGLPEVADDESIWLQLGNDPRGADPMDTYR
jgi:hypothetical protein